jgi:hypothetical protein
MIDKTFYRADVELEDGKTLMVIQDEKPEIGEKVYGKLFWPFEGNSALHNGIVKRVISLYEYYK